MQLPFRARPVVFRAVQPSRRWLLYLLVALFILFYLLLTWRRSAEAHWQMTDPMGVHYDPLRSSSMCLRPEYSYYDFNPIAESFQPKRDFKIFMGPPGKFVGESDCFDHNHHASCTPELRCIFSQDPSFYESSDAAIFALNFFPPEEEAFFLRTRPPQQIWAGFQLEKASYFPRLKTIIEGKDPNFDLALSYYPDFFTSHHFPLSYLFMGFDHFLNEAAWATEYRKSNPPSEVGLAPIAYVSRKCRPPRDELVQRIMEQFPVDSYGHCLHNQDFPPGREFNKTHVMLHHKFCLAIENSIEDVDLERDGMWAAPVNEDYVTEKLWDCLRAGSVPIVFGPRSIYKFLPDRDRTAVILGEYSSLEEAMDYVKYLDSNPDAYAEYQQWPKRYSLDWYERFKRLDWATQNCALCEYLANLADDRAP